MRKVILFAASSLDGFIARPDGAIDWLFQEGDYGFSEFVSTVDAVVLGRKTYEVAQALGDDTLTAGEHWVVSRTPEAYKGSKARFGSLAQVGEWLKSSESEKAVWLIGGGELTTAFLDNGWLHEIVLAIHPRLLGQGIPVSPGLMRDAVLKYTKHKAYDNGLLQVWYDVVS
ncbi:dihydrofolate reductase [bacterium]|nr:dihydrofolate reductase [bacterium]